MPGYPSRKEVIDNAYDRQSFSESEQIRQYAGDAVTHHGVGPLTILGFEGEIAEFLDERVYDDMLDLYKESVFEHINR